MTRTINLGAAAVMLAELPKRGRLFARLPSDSAVVSTRYGQWRRQRQARENRAAEADVRHPSHFRASGCPISGTPSPAHRWWTTIPASSGYPSTSATRW
ncbi:hypothetical protein [Belnapia sp. F-4-1]|uniref:hypothetical protein n=1 Tax=Belnapia sp. F-4-1 TaxID=1545443 RepID=UPI001364C1D1|nr:hypothetical protein [Belnapia sp. F-4-1]